MFGWLTLAKWDVKDIRLVLLDFIQYALCIIFTSNYHHSCVELITHCVSKWCEEICNMTDWIIGSDTGSLGLSIGGITILIKQDQTCSDKIRHVRSAYLCKVRR